MHPTLNGHIPAHYVVPTIEEAPSTSPPVGSSSDPFGDVQKLRLSQDFTAMAPVKKLTTDIQVRKPGKENFFRVHMDEVYGIQTNVIELREKSEFYLVNPAIWCELDQEPTFGPRQLVTAINRDGQIFVWPLRLPRPDGQLDSWSRSALEGCAAAKEAWVRLRPNHLTSKYDVFEAQGQLKDPEWGELPKFNEILRLAFRPLRRHAGPPCAPAIAG